MPRFLSPARSFLNPELRCGWPLLRHHGLAPRGAGYSIATTGNEANGQHRAPQLSNTWRLLCTAAMMIRRDFYTSAKNHWCE
jgi:hypothetical protein